MHPTLQPSETGAKRLSTRRGFVFVSCIVLGILVLSSIAVLQHWKTEERLQRQSAARADELRQLVQIKTELAGLEAYKRDELLRHAEKSAADTVSYARSLGDTAVAAQREIAVALENSRQDLDRFAAKRANADFDRVIAAHTRADELHGEIIARQQELLGKLALQQPGHAAVVAQAKARAAQLKVGIALNELAAARDISRGSRLRTREEQEYDHHTYHLARAERRRVEIPHGLERLAVREEELTAMARAVAKGSAQATDEARARLEMQANTVKQALSELATQKAGQEKLLEQTGATLARHAPKAAELEALLELHPVPPTLQDQKASDLLKRAVELQQWAVELQESAGKALVDFPAKVDREGLIHAVESLGESPPGESAASNDEDFTSLAQAIRASYMRVYAMEKAMVGCVPFADSVPAATSFGSPAGTAFPEREAVCGQADPALASAHTLLDHARRLVVGQESPGQRHEVVERLQRYASADPNDAARDLTGLWKGDPRAKCGLIPGGPGGPPPLDGKTVSLPAFSLLEREASPPASWLFVDHWHVLGPFDNTERANLNTPFVPECMVDLQAIYPGKNGVAIGWERVRAHEPNVMPPFRSYNLARKIEGLDDKTAYLHNLRYTVYYAYTELFFESACDHWLAIGSDDSSKMWVNDQPVWISAKSSKAWKADEGYRKVHFNAGVNRVLYRVENGSDRTEFSLLIGMQE